MNENAKLWVEALRSGEYEQGRGALCTIDEPKKNCCLGVACELYIRAYPGDLKITEGVGNRIDYDGHSAVLPEKVVAWLGLCTASGEYLGGQLTSDNDTGCSFDWIANKIDSEPNGLFVSDAT